MKDIKCVRVSNFGGPEVLSVERTRPFAALNELQSHQILVRTAYAGVNPVETYIREGQFSILPPLPYTPGCDGSGLVEEVGSGVKGFKKGDRVFCTGSNSGTYSEFVICDKNYVYPLPPALTFAQGAALGIPYFTAYKALVISAKAKPGENVLVHGASGAVGTAAVQIARALGNIVVGTAGTKEGMDVVSKCGAHHVFNHNHKGYDKKMVEHLSTHENSSDGGGLSQDCSPNGFDVIIEHLANINLPSDLQMLRKGGRVMIVGCRGPVTINPRHLMAPETSIHGVQITSSLVSEYREMGCAIVAGIESGWVRPVINRVYSMDQVQDVHRDIMNSKGAKGKLVLKVCDIDET